MGRSPSPPVHATGGWRGPPSSAVKRVTDPSCVQGALRQQLSTRGALQSRLVPNGGTGRCGWRPTGAAAQGWRSTVRSTGQGEGRHRRSRRRAPVGWREGDGNGGWTAGPTSLCLPLLFYCSDLVWTRAPRRRGGGCSGWPTPLPRWRPTRRVGGGRAVWRTGTDRSVVAHARSPAGRHARPFPHVQSGRSQW